MPDAHKNFATTTVTVAPSPATSGTSLTVADATVFPATPFNATVCPPETRPTNANAEIVRVTLIAGNVLTIVRTQESTSARSIQANDVISNAPTAKTFTDLEIAKVVDLDFGTDLYQKSKLFTITDSDVTEDSKIIATPTFDISTDDYEMDQIDIAVQPGDGEFYVWATSRNGSSLHGIYTISYFVMPMP